MKVALTGATGFVGSHVLTALHKSGHDVMALVRAGTAATAPPPPEGRRPMSLREPELLGLQRCVPEGGDDDEPVSVPLAGLASGRGEAADLDGASAV
jgi:nucleoside-diphosphate-sugar epimerase